MGQDDLIEQLLSHYERLSDEIQTELPLKRIWTLADTSVD
jgi:predicted Mrr-cat superfamily restriction endonuclease